jgi:asparagine synthase (glutamine-hydrolysing)
MCGIIGSVSLDGSPVTTSEDTFQLLMNKMDYRGPDDRALWYNSQRSVALGHLRLSILDTSSHGQQPMHHQNVNGEYTIVFNGEVYNFVELRAELVKLGYVFSTTTDTEVILAAYVAWGKNCIKRFNGMFAIAIWDQRSGELFVVRDRIGIKPLYYNHDPLRQIFSFASEVKSLRPLVGQDTTIDPRLLHQYMQFGYIPGEDTLSKGIKRLLPGHSLTLKAGEMMIEKYWDLDFGTKKDKGFDNYVEEGREILSSSLDLRLRTDVPLGVFLSGGLDSSAVVGMLAQKVDKPIKTFSVGYDFGQEFDESHYANMVSKQFKTDHKTIMMKPSDFESYIPGFVSTMDEPVTEAAALSLHFVSELAQEDVKVVMSGEGSDELFAGYDLYQYMQKLEMCRKVATPAGAKLASMLGEAVLPKGHKVRKYLDMATKPFEERYQGISVYDKVHENKLYRKDFAALVNREPHPALSEFYDELFDSTKDNDLLSRMLKFDIKTWLVDDLLTKADRMSMGSSLELRVPFLDHRMAEFAARLPSKHKVHQGEGKYILKKMMEGLLPKEIIYREKMGFPTPLKMMFMGPLKAYTSDTLINKSAKIRDYFEMDYVRHLCESHFSGKADNHRILWQLIVIEEWLQQNT